MVTTAPGNGAPIGGLKVVTAQGGSRRVRPAPKSLQAVRRKLSGADHLHRIQDEAQALIGRALAGLTS